MLTTYKCTFQPLTLHLLYRPKFLNVSLRYHPGWPLRRLKFNMSKTELLIFNPKPGPITSFHITVGSTIIHPVAQARCLGVTLDSSLTFKMYLKPVAFSSAILQRYALSSVARLLKL
ncbi:hypothetical protein FKM82_025531 [Ascaphus truei]